ncbi:hypothetical protein [Sporosarcina sp. Te-1]|uniref:hypothetical protein n=1 Tax=Sporosarcina sp. Te-1 TaxID=2818390 RepID=UPI001A9FBD26|nr:hypothetical protein [Sporosarcina sp. Te-1]QTD40076.1 hypothetical protein J3U78_14770 [Sporosarcina sp. Te-1]
MKHKFPLPFFFASSAYSIPKQIAVRVTLLLVLAYLVVQMAMVNVAIYNISALPIYLFYNVAISIVLVYFLTVYFSVSVVFNYREYGLMASLPIKPQRIVSAKVISSLLLPILLTSILQIPVLVLLVLGMKWEALLKTILLLPTLLVFTVMLLVFLLSLIQLSRKHLTIMASLLLNGAASLGIAIGFILWIVTSSKLKLTTLWSDFSMDTFSSLVQSVNTLMDRIYTAAGQVPLLKQVIAAYTSSGISLRFLLLLFLFWFVSFLLYQGAVQSLAVNYLQNGRAEMGSATFKKSKAYAGENEWGRYFQRERWVLQSEPYFKLQVLLSMILTPVVSIGLLLADQKQWMPTDFFEGGRLEIVFAYIVLFLSCMNNTSGTPYSREGKYYSLLQSLPFDQRKIYLTKVLFSSLIGAISIGSSFVIFLLFGYATVHSLMLAAVVLLLMISYNLLAPLYDRKHPLTEWKNPSEAIKSNPNVIFSLLYGLPLLLILSALHFCLLWTALPIGLSTAIILIIVLVCDLLILKKMALRS